MAGPGSSKPYQCCVSIIEAMSSMEKGGWFLKKPWCCIGGGIEINLRFINPVDNCEKVNWPPQRDSEVLAFQALQCSPSSELIANAENFSTRISLR